VSARPVTVVGGTVAALVAADAAARAGREVELYLPKKGVGGGFSPVKVGGRSLERGIRVFELRYEGVGDPPPIEEYDPRTGHRPFARLVEEYISELVGPALVELSRPRMWFRGRMASEIYLATDLSGLRELLSGEEADAVAAEARAAVDERGESGVFDGEDLWKIALTEASLANHGRTFHELLLDPICRKIRPEGGDDVLAALRRKIWMPLFWPRTVLEAATGEAIEFRPERPFHTISPGGTGAVVEKLLERVEGSGGVRVARIDGVEAVAPRDGRTAIALVGGETVEAQRPILALAPGDLFGAAGLEYKPDRVRSALCWVEAAEDDVLELPSVLHVTDPDVPLFRLTPGASGGGRQVLTLELRHDTTEDEAPAAVRESLERLGIVREGAELAQLAFFAGKTFTAPTADSKRRFDAAREQLAELELDAEIVGGAGWFGADSLNEQLIQGLRAAVLACDRV
jgi:hypothetical protein